MELLVASVTVLSLSWFAFICCLTYGQQKRPHPDVLHCQLREYLQAADWRAALALCRRFPGWRFANACELTILTEPRKMTAIVAMTKSYVEERPRRLSCAQLVIEITTLTLWCGALVAAVQQPVLDWALFNAVLFTGLSLFTVILPLAMARYLLWGNKIILYEPEVACLDLLQRTLAPAVIPRF